MLIRRLLLEERWARGIARAPLLAALGGLLVVGLGVGAYLALSGGGTDEAPPAVQATEQVSPAPSAVPAILTPVVAPIEEAHQLIIPKIGVNAPVATYGLDANQIPLVPQGPDASQVVAWYNFSARPGMHGNVVYAGHVTWNGHAVFFNLDEVVPGDTIHLKDRRGAEAVYQVTDKVSLSPSDPRSVDVIMPTPDDVITIVTCGGTHYQTNDPIAGADYTARTVIRGKLISIKTV